MTPLDTLKDTLLRTTELIDCAQDSIAGSCCSGSHEDDLEIVDAAVKVLWEAVAAHVPGVRYEHPHYTEAGYKAVHTYDDDSPVLELIELRGGSVATYFPRHDGDREKFIERLSAGVRAPLKIVGDEGGRSDE